MSLSDKQKKNTSPAVAGSPQKNGAGGRVDGIKSSSCSGAGSSGRNNDNDEERMRKQETVTEQKTRE